jgi:hypothetical protein
MVRYTVALQNPTDAKYTVMNLVERYRFRLVAKEQVSTGIRNSKTITRPTQITTLFLVKKSSKIPKLHHDMGANCTVLTKFIHPSEHVRTKHAYLDKGRKTSVIIVGEETVKV